MKKFFYRVGEGESLFSIARKFNLSPFTLIYDNNLLADVEWGDIVFINCENQTYKPLPLDDFSTVSKRLNISKERLISLNGNIPYLFYGVDINI